MHLLGVDHASPANPRAVKEVAQAVEPDSIALEASSLDRSKVRAASDSPYLKPLLERMMSTPVEGINQAFGQLTTHELKNWELGMRSSGLALGEVGAYKHYLYGWSFASECLAGGFSPSSN